MIDKNISFWILQSLYHKFRNPMTVTVSLHTALCTVLEEVQQRPIAKFSNNKLKYLSISLSFCFVN